MASRNTGRTVVAPANPNHRDVRVVLDNTDQHRRSDNNRDANRRRDDSRGRGGDRGNIRYQERDGEFLFVPLHMCVRTPADMLSFLTLRWL